MIKSVFFKINHTIAHTNFSKHCDLNKIIIFRGKSFAI